MFLLFLLGCTQNDGSLSPLVGGAGPAEPEKIVATQPAEGVGEAPPLPPDLEVLWETRTHPVFSLQFADEDWADRLEALIPEGSCDERPYLSADLVFTNPTTGAEEHWDDVGVRYRGHSALSNPNYSNQTRWGLKLDFDTFSPGREFHGVERLNLLGTEGDPSLLRERMALEVMRAAGVPAAYANHAWLVVNGEPLGVFPLVEEPDDRAFLANHEGDPDGHLYKVAGYCHGTTLDYEGEDIGGYTGFEAKAGASDADKAVDLVPIFACLDGNHSDSTVRACLETKIDVAEWLAEMAVDAYVRNVDGMASTGQNFLLYTPTSRPASVLPYDMDLAWYADSEALVGSGIFDLRPDWEPSLPVLPQRVRELWQDDYCTAVLAVAEREGPDALVARIRAVEATLHDPMDEDPFLSDEAWAAAVDRLVHQVEDRHDDAVDAARRCELPAPPEVPEEPTDTAAP